MSMTQSREQFSSRLGFILAAAGSAVGIGNLVGFPVNAAKSGGGAFLLIYALFVILICIPVMMAEMALGRHTRSNPVGAYNKIAQDKPMWKIGGWLALITPFMIAVFYQVITVWLLAYLLGSVTGNLDVLANGDFFGGFIQSYGVFVYLGLLTVIVGIILNSGVQKGIERLAKLLMPALIIMLVCLALFVLTLPNAIAGVSYYLIPDFSKITPEVVNLALGQAFFSLSLGMGILITYGSYISSKENIVKGAKTVAFVDTSVAFFAGLLILPAIFVFNPQVNPQELASSSVSLVFTFLPKIFLSLQSIVGYVGASIFASIFFLSVFFAALTSQVSILQVPISAIQDQLKFSRTKSVLLLGLGAVLFVLASTVSFGLVPFFTEFINYGGGAKSFFDLIVDVFYETILPLNGLIVCLFVTYCWKRSRLNGELSIGYDGYSTSLTKKYINFSLGTFIPIILFLVFINTVLLKFFQIDMIKLLFAS